jgi:hypothetical protein
MDGGVEAAGGGVTTAATGGEVWGAEAGGAVVLPGSAGVLFDWTGGVVGAVVDSLQPLKSAHKMEAKATLKIVLVFILLIRFKFTDAR